MTFMRRAHLLPAVLAIAACLGWSAQARATLYEDLGGKSKIEAFTNDFVDRLNADPRIQRYFEHANLPHLKAELAVQFCNLADGPCTYTGKDMKSAHDGMHLRDGDFNALAEDLQNAMSAADVPFRTQNRLLALLAPMHADVVGR